MKNISEIIYQGAEGQLGPYFNLYEASDQNTVKDMLKKNFKYKEKDFKIVSSRRLAILIDGNRQGELEKIANFLVPLGGKYNRSTKLSSIGHVDYLDQSIFVKPRSRQGHKSAGLDNEFVLTDAITTFIADNGGPLDIEFKGGGSFLCKDIVEVIDAGRDTTGRKKADIILKSDKGKLYPVSIKKDGAEIWESADSYWGAKAGEYIKKLAAEGKIKLDIQNAGFYKISPNFAVKATDKETRDVVFGSDLEGKGAVVTRTFRSGDFSYDGAKNILQIGTTSIVSKVGEIKGKDTVWFLVRNDSTRKVKAIGYDGIRVLAVKESRINKNVLRVR